MATLRSPRSIKALKGLFILLAALLPVLGAGCTDNDAQLYSQIPAKISSFVSQYYPGQKVVSYKPDPSGSTVVVANGPTIVFDQACKWVSVDGNGSVLPQVMLFDQLPPAVYEYLQDNSDLNSVFSISRDSRDYTVTLLESTLVYDISTGELQGR